MSMDGTRRSTSNSKFLLAFPVDPEYKPLIHESIFNLVYFSEGAFSFGDVYDMPIFLRKFYIDQLVKTKETENQKISAAQKGMGPDIKSPGG